MRPKLFLVLIALIVVPVGLVFLVVDPDEEASQSTIAATPSPAVSQPGTATPSQANAQTVVWTEIAPSATPDESQGTMFLLDTETGKIFSPTDRNTQDGPYTSITWGPDGNLSVQMYPRRSGETAGDTFLIGPPLGPMTPVSATETYVSSRGVAASYEPGAVTMVVIREVATRRELARLPLGPGQSVGPWSPDGRYLSTRTGGSPSEGKNPLTSIWDIETGQVVLELTAFGVSWGNQHSRFMYDVVDFTRGEDWVGESRVHDMESGSDYVINSRAGVVMWSPDDRYLVGDANAGDRIYAFSVFDTRDGRELMTARGSWPMAWVDEDTIGFMGDVCTETPSLFYVDADGSGLKMVLDDIGYGVAHPAPGGNKVAFTDYGDLPQQPNIVKVLTLSSNVMQEFDVGHTYLMPNPWPTSATWSPDQRYLLLRAPIGKGGPCMGDVVAPFQLIRHP